MKKNERNPIFANIFLKLLPLAFAFGLILLAASTSPAWAYSGDYALEFDGETDWVELGPTRDVIGINWQTTKTISLWVRPARTAGTSVLDVVDGDMIIGDHPRWFGIYQTNWAGTDRIWVYNNDNSSGDGTPAFRAIGIDYTVSEWMHITLVHGNGFLTAYKNGVEIASRSIGPTANGHLNPNDLLLRFGGSVSRESGGYDGTFAGQIDELRIYSTALSGDDIRRDLYRTLEGNESGLAGYYKMSNGTGTTVTDDSGNGNHGTLRDGEFPLPPPPTIPIVVPDGDYAEWITSGAFAGPRNALDFDGSDNYVSVPADITLPANLTLEAWVYPRITNGQNWIAGEVGGAQLTMDGTTAQFRIHDGTSLQGPATASLVANEWQHIAGTYDGTDLRIYVNGVEGTAASLSGNNFDPGGIFAIGGDGSSFNNILIDEVRLWDTARTREQIRENMFQTLQGSESGLGAYYRFDQSAAATGGSTTLYDLTSNGNHGTLNNMDPATDWVASTAFNTWIGSESSNWAAGGNWSRYTAPASTDNAGIYYHIANNAPVIGTAVSVDDLTVAAGGSLTVNSGGSLSLAGSLFNHGTLAQTQPVDGSGPVNFFNTGSYGGLTLNPEMQNLGVTTVTIRGNQNCTAVAGETVERCFDISPGVPSPVGSTTLTFYFDSSELSGNSCAALDAFHWNGASWNVLPRDPSYNGDGRLCGSDPQSIQITGVTDFSPFVLKVNLPNAIVIENFSGNSAPTTLLPALGFLLLLGLPLGLIIKKRIKM